MQYAQQVRHLLWAAPVYVAAAGCCGRSCQFGSVKRQLWRVLLLRVMVLLLVLWGMLPSCCRRRTVPCLLVDRAQRLAAWQQRVGGRRAGQRLLDGADGSQPSGSPCCRFCNSSSRRAGRGMQVSRCSTSPSLLMQHCGSGSGGTAVAHLGHPAYAASLPLGAALLAGHYLRSGPRSGRSVSRGRPPGRAQG